jgi:hypothetical protein
MSEKCFYILKGTQGATYVLNTSGLKAINESLKFYKARNWPSALKKNLFAAFLWLAGKLRFSQLLSLAEVRQQLFAWFSVNLPLDFDEACSLHISPTRDKIVVNHHNGSFTKTAFGKSYTKVKREAQHYQKLQKNYHYFTLSQLEQFTVSESGYCSLRLHNPAVPIKNKKGFNPVSLLVELFGSCGLKSVTVSELSQGLLQALDNNSQFDFTRHKEQLHQIIKIRGAQTLFLGFEHRDFKPWNLSLLDKPLLYDFEEALTEGFPLADLLNYYFDPLMARYPAKKVLSKALDKKHQRLYRQYMEALQLSLPFDVLLFLYVLRRILFWQNEKAKAAAFYELSLSLLAHDEIG